MDIEVGQLWRYRSSSTYNYIEIMDIRPHDRYKRAISIKYTDGVLGVMYPNHFEPQGIGLELTTAEAYGMSLLNELP